MLIIILLFSVVLLAGLIATIIGNRWILFIVPSWMNALFILFSIIGFFLVITESSEISTGLIRQSWPTAKATVVETSIIGERAYSPEITCEYNVAGKKYTHKTDLQTPGFGRKKSRQQTSRIIIAQYPVGTEINIYYNPDNPEESFVRTGPYWNNYLVLSFGYFVLLSGLITIFGLFFQKRQH